MKDKPWIEFDNPAAAKAEQAYGGLIPVIGGRNREAVQGQLF